MTRWPRVLIVGASSGIGEALARRLAAEGSSLALVARRGERLEQIASQLQSDKSKVLGFAHDVRDTARTGALFQQITHELGGLDLVVYAAGILPRVGAREYPVSTDVDTLETNLIGAVVWLDQAAHRFDIARAGTIIGISSVAGDRGRRGNPAYNASKAGLDTFLESLRNRLAVRGVTVTTAKPGWVRTAMLETTSTPPFIPVISPEEAARQILEAAAGKERVAYIPSWWRSIMLVTRSIPSPIFERLPF